MPIAAYSLFEHLAGGAVRVTDDRLSDFRRGQVLPSRQPGRTGREAEARKPAMPTKSTETKMASKANLKSSGREVVLARRRALSTAGKASVSTSANPSANPSVKRAGTGPVRQRAASPAAVAPRPARTRPLAPPAVAESAPASAVAASPPRQRPSAGARQSRPAVSAARSRREALSRAGRRAVSSRDRVRGASKPAAPAAPAAVAKQAPPAKVDSGFAAPTPRPAARQVGRVKAASGNGVARRDAGLAIKPTGRMLSLARRLAQSGRGKAATNAPTSAAGLARQANPKLSGRELAQRVRAQRSHNGGAGERKSAPSGRSRARGAADQHWKVGTSETAAGQVVTGTRVGRSPRTTGDEPSTCRTITGTEYMGADIFRAFCHGDPPPAVPKVGVSQSGLGNRVTGNEVGRSAKVTGDEPGSCKRVTGTDYLSPGHFEAFCETRPEPASGRHTGLTATRGGQQVSGTQVGRSSKVTGDEQGAGVRTTGTQYTDVQSIAEGIPAHLGGGRSAGTLPPGAFAAGRASSASGGVPEKVAVSSTLSGGRVTGTLVGRSARVTGDEPGSCRSVTGDEYLSGEQFEQFCASRPRPEPPKVGESRTGLGQRVSGTLTGRSSRVTGDEPGTCKIVTGTPYAGMEQIDAYCAPPARQAARERMVPMARRGAGAGMTGQAPGIGGRVSGDARGACEPLTGTPYVSSAQQAAACQGGQLGAQSVPAAARAATPDEPDFPQPLTGAPWAGFSVASPARRADARRAVRTGAVTGTSSEGGGRITGPFGMATGKITGTEEFRFGAANAATGTGVSHESGENAAASGARLVTGEGQSTGLKITGDDWDRGEHVTGTEGAWAKQRNPTRPGPMGAMPSFERKRNEDKPLPVSRVTGSSGSTDRGALITYSGGARG